MGAAVGLVAANATMFLYRTVTGQYYYRTIPSFSRTLCGFLLAVGVAVIGVVFAHNFIIKFVLTAAILFIVTFTVPSCTSCGRSLWALCGGICCTAKHNYCKGKVVYQNEALRHTRVDHRAAGPASYDNRRLRNDVWQLGQ